MCFDGTAESSPRLEKNPYRTVFKFQLTQWNDYPMPQRNKILNPFRITLNWWVYNSSYQRQRPVAWCRSNYYGFSTRCSVSAVKDENEGTSHIPTGDSFPAINNHPIHVCERCLETIFKIATDKAFFCLIS